MKSYLHHLELLIRDRAKQEASRGTVRLEQGVSKFLASHGSDEAKPNKPGRRTALAKGSSAAICMRPPPSELRGKPRRTDTVKGWASYGRGAAVCFQSMLFWATRFGKCVWRLSQPHGAGPENVPFLKKVVLKKFGMQSECKQLSALHPASEAMQEQEIQGAYTGSERASAQGSGFLLKPERKQAAAKPLHIHTEIFWCCLQEQWLQSPLTDDAPPLCWAVRWSAVPWPSRRLLLQNLEGRGKLKPEKLQTRPSSLPQQSRKGCPQRETLALGRGQCFSGRHPGNMGEHAVCNEPPAPRVWRSEMRMVGA